MAVDPMKVESSRLIVPEEGQILQASEVSLADGARIQWDYVRYR